MPGRDCTGLGFVQEMGSKVSWTHGITIESGERLDCGDLWGLKSYCVLNVLPAVLSASCLCVYLCVCV